jgi:hypothetical protein
MNIRQHVLDLIETYGEANKISGSRVTTIAMGSGNVYRTLKEGGNITLNRVEDAVRWFSTNWPADLAWPADVPRPLAPVSEPQPEEAA